MTSTLESTALLDTNILTSIRDEEHSRHSEIGSYVAEMRGRARLIVAPQSIYEYWSVASRPKDVNGMGRTPFQAALDVDAFLRAFNVLPDPPELLEEWLHLCRTHGVSGKPAHDARLGAYARLHGISTLVTLNPRDFGRYGLNVVVP